MVFYGAWQPIALPTSEFPTYDDWCMESTRVLPRTQPDDWPLEYLGRGFAIAPPWNTGVTTYPHVSSVGYQSWASWGPSERRTGANHPTYPGLFAIQPGEGWNPVYPFANESSWPPDVIGWTLRMPDGRTSPDFYDYGLMRDYYGTTEGDARYDEWYYAGGESDFYQWQGTQYIPCPEFKASVRHDNVTRPIVVALGYVADSGLHFTDIGWHQFGHIAAEYISPATVDVVFTQNLTYYFDPIGGWDDGNRFYEPNQLLPVPKHVNNAGPYSDFQTIICRAESQSGGSWQGFADMRGYGAQWNDFRWIYAVDRSGPAAASPLDFSRVGTGTRKMLFDAPGGM
jgi:hypothetical protein